MGGSEAMTRTSDYLRMRRSGMASAHRRFRVLVAVLFIVALVAHDPVHGAPPENIIFVDCDATSGNNNGSSWKNAFIDLQLALDAVAGTVESWEIWVAEGVYYPARTSTDPTATFALQDRVGLYGGFSGDETYRSERDWDANVTVLSGDLGRDDSADLNGVVTDVDDIIGRNAYRVITAVSVGSSTVLDGFVVTAGDADYAMGSVHSGAGVYNDNSSPTLTNLTFSGNRASWYGGGMSNMHDSGPTLVDVTFRNNEAGYGGGGMSNGDDSSPTLTDVTFIGNVATDGGGIASYESGPALTNVTFTGNQAAERGGGMYNSSSSPTLRNVTFTGNQGEYGGGMYNSSSTPMVTNVTLTGNRAADGGGMYNSFGSPTLINLTFGSNRADALGGGVYNDNSSPTLANCILWGNEAPASQQIHNQGTSLPDVTFCDIEGGYFGETNIAADPAFVDPVSPYEAPTTAGDYHLAQGSPAVDTGTNAAVSVDTDLDGNPRIVDGTGDGSAVVDMGAYELQRLFVVRLPLVIRSD